MKIRVFPSHSDTYNSIVIDTDNLQFSNYRNESLPSIFIDDLISDLISEN